MRCAVDTATLPLADVPPAPVKPPRTTQATRMQRMAYEGPKERARCETCLHSTFELGQAGPALCELGSFPVLRGGLCREWTA